ncbi:MFS transporter [Acinetobacter stercoris]|uniref:Molecular chaperone DnaJ n=1 Tax=Acinetobacter stercoris TaxID=2126983 RepID=A0A2U3MVX1_9GAMM|nr:MFS transporter [Acinetobacter stercoris]SPL69525.1 hypothetical protein KPC_0703 [Acinetobacter stercoris]
MSPWQRLAIQPTTDLRSIKKAYAKQLKLIDQEIQPDEFIALRAALEHALFEAENNLVEDEDNDLFSENEILEQERQQSDLSEFSTNEASSLANQYQNLKQNIETENIHFDLRLALHDFNTLLESCQTNELKLHYSGQINNLLVQHQLDDFLYIFEGLHNQPADFDQQLLNDSLTITDDADENSVENDDAEYTLQQQPSPLDTVVQALWNHDVSDQIFHQYQDLLNHQYDLTLEEQLQIKDQLTYPLSELEMDIFNPNYSRFLALWHDHYPDELDLYDQSYYSHTLQEKIQHYLKHHHFLEKLPHHQRDIIQKFSGKQKFQPLAVLNLQKTMSDAYSDGNTLTHLDQFNLVNTDQNANYLFLKSINQWHKFIWGSILLAISTTLLIKPIFVDSTFVLLSIFFLSLFLFFVFIQAPLQAICASHENQENNLIQYSKYWFISGFALIWLTPLLLPIAHTILSYIWLVGSIFLIGCLQLTAAPYANRFYQSCQNKMDYFVITTGVLVLFLGIVALYYLTGEPVYPWLIVYSLMPMSMILFPESFQELFYSFGYRKSDKQLNYQQVIIKSIVVIAIRLGIFIAAAVYLSSKASQPYLYLATFSFACIGITAIPSRYLSSILKYLSYVILIIATLKSLIFAGILVYYLFKSRKQSRSQHA